MGRYFFFDGEVVLDVVVEDLQVLHDLRVQRHLLEQIMPYLVVLNHPQHAHLPLQRSQKINLT
jgi:hypothetical protein